jgi:hypothetical protein
LGIQATRQRILANLQVFVSPQVTSFIHLKKLINFFFDSDTFIRNNERCAIESQELSNKFWKRVSPIITNDDIEGIRPYGFGTEGVWKPVSMKHFHYLNTKISLISNFVFLFLFLFLSPSFFLFLFLFLTLSSL